MEQRYYHKPLLLIINEPPGYQDLFIDAFDKEFDITFMPALTHQLKRQRFRLGNVRPFPKRLNVDFWVISVDFSPDGRWLAARGVGDSGIVFDLWNNKETAIQHPKETSWSNRILFSPNGKLLAVDGNPVTIWQVGSWEKPALQGRAHRNISFTPTSLTLAVGSCCSEVLQWRLKTGMTSKINLAQIIITTCVEYSPGGNYLVIAGGPTNWQAGLIEIWQTKEEKLVKKLKGHNLEIYDLDFTPGGTLLASCSNDGTVRLWDISDIADPASRSVNTADKLPITWASLKSEE